MSRVNPQLVEHAILVFQCVLQAMEDLGIVPAYNAEMLSTLDRESEEFKTEVQRLLAACT